MIPDDPEVPDMIVALREALDSPDPLDLLSIASGILAALEPLPGPFGSPLDDDDPIVDVSEFMDMLVSMPSEETDSLLVACAELLDDPVLQAIVQTEVRPRIQVMPPWLAELARLRVTRAVLLESVLDGEETIALQATGPRGGFTLMVAIERLGSPFVEDAYAISETIDGLIDRLDQDQPEDLVVRPLQLKDARARIEDGLETTGMLVPPVETETWPGFRPLLEWALRGIPEGGEGYIYEEWEQEDIEAFLDEFMESRHAFGYLRRDRQLAGLLVDFALNYGTWDPRQWSPRFVERVLLDLIPRKVMYPLEDLQAFPRILGALVMFGNESLNIPDSHPAGAEPDRRADPPLPGTH